MADVRQIAHVTSYIDAEVAEADRRIIAHVSAYVDGTEATADRRIIAHVSAYVAEVLTPPSALICYGVAFQDKDGITTAVVGDVMPGDRSAWDVVDYPEYHANDIANNTPLYHMPSDNRAVGDIAYWNGSKWVTTNAPTFGGIVALESGIIKNITTVTDTYTILTTDYTVVCNKATAFTVTLPSTPVGQEFNIANIGAGTVTVSGSIDGETSQDIPQWDSMKVQCIAADTWKII